MSAYRHAIAIALVGCFQFATVQAQTPVLVLSPRCSVVIDPKEKPKAIHLEFLITTTDVVEKVRLFYRESGKTKYSDQQLKLNRELLYEASIPYSEKIEYYLAVTPEKGVALTLGSSASPQVFLSEGLPRVAEVRQIRFKKAAIIGVAITVGILVAFLGAERLGKK